MTIQTGVNNCILRELSEGCRKNIVPASLIVNGCKFIFIEYKLFKPTPQRRYCLMTADNKKSGIQILKIPLLRWVWCGLTTSQNSTPKPPKLFDRLLCAALRIHETHQESNCNHYIIHFLHHTNTSDTCPAHIYRRIVCNWVSACSVN